MNLSWKTISLLGVAAALVTVAARRGHRHSFRGQTVVITGGARGLGLELARLWVAEGARVAICSRTADQLQRAVRELQRVGGQAYAEVCDVTDGTQVTAFIQRVTEKWGRVDVLVNNAGIIQTGPLECMTEEDFRKALATHFWGPLYAVNAVLPQMRSRGAGRIVNISSIGGRISVPHLLPYCVSKFALAGLSEGLRTELAREGIVVTTVCPGMMRTGSPRNAEFKGSHRAEYAWFSISAALPIVATGSRLAARRIIEACRRGDSEMSPSLPAGLAMRLHALAREAGISVLEMANRFLPGADGTDAAAYKGWQSFSAWSPSWITTLNEQAALRNNEMPARAVTR